MNTPRWTQHFLHNRQQFTEPSLPHDGTHLPDHVRRPLVRSLAIFQLGETGGGSRLMHYVRQVVQIDQLKGYEESVGLFIEEEQYHSRLLDRLVRYLGGQTMEKQWTNSIFRWLRNHFGVEFNIQVLLIAELIAEVYFGLLYRKSHDPLVKICCHKILGDEMRHIAFHTEFLRERLEAMPAWWRRLWRAQFWCLQRVTACVVAFDHRDCFLSLETHPLEVARMAFKTGDRFLRRLQTPQTLWLAKSSTMFQSGPRRA
jgi:hypothetical protein